MTMIFQLSHLTSTPFIPVEIPEQFQHILHAERVEIVGDDLINANS